MRHSTPDQKRNNRFGQDEPEAWCAPEGMSASTLKRASEALITALIHFIGPLQPEAIKTSKKEDHVKFTSSIVAQGAGDMPTELYKQNL